MVFRLHFNTYKRICYLFALAILLFHSSAKASATEPKDSIVAQVLNPLNPPLEQQNLISKMNREQLSDLVDQLMEMDTIPVDLIKQVQLAAGIFARNEHPAGISSEQSAGYPSEEFYNSWEINNLFPEKDMLKMKGDTSITLFLSGGERGEYTHPFNGPITSTFGWRDSTEHKGIDIDLNKGDKVMAAFDGMVRIA
jgi:murein DD-endopeptidase MepM/ murein hydrolase activator NlpD